MLTVGASDSSGGSGIQADLRTLAAMRMHGASVVTAVVSRNTRGTTDVYPQPATVVSGQLGAVLEDLPVAAVKTGMSPHPETAIAVAARARSGALPNLVVDPVLESAGGPRSAGASRKGLAAALERLLPHALVATPNREEASLLVGWEVVTPDDMAKAAAQLSAGGPRYVVITGGNFVVGDNAIDVVWADGAARMLHSPRPAAATPTAAVPRSRPPSRPGSPSATTRRRRSPGRRGSSAGRSATPPTGGSAPHRPNRPVRLVGPHPAVVGAAAGMMHVWTRRR